MKNNDYKIKKHLDGISKHISEMMKFIASLVDMASSTNVKEKEIKKRGRPVVKKKKASNKC